MEITLIIIGLIEVFTLWYIGAKYLQMVILASKFDKNHTEISKYAAQIEAQGSKMIQLHKEIGQNIQAARINVELANENLQERLKK